MHPEALGGGVAEFDAAVARRECPYLSQLGEAALGEMRDVYVQLDAGDYSGLGELAEQLAAAVQQPAAESAPKVTPPEECAEQVPPAVAEQAAAADLPVQELSVATTPAEEQERVRPPEPTERPEQRPQNKAAENKTRAPALPAVEAEQPQDLPRPAAEAPRPERPVVAALEAAPLEAVRRVEPPRQEPSPDLSLTAVQSEQRQPLEQLPALLPLVREAVADRTEPLEPELYTAYAQQTEQLGLLEQLEATTYQLAEALDDPVAYDPVAEAEAVLTAAAVEAGVQTDLLSAEVVAAASNAELPAADRTAAPELAPAEGMAPDAARVALEAADEYNPEDTAEIEAAPEVITWEQVLQAEPAELYDSFTESLQLLLASSEPGSEQEQEPELAEPAELLPGADAYPEAAAIAAEGTEAEVAETSEATELPGLAEPQLAIETAEAPPLPLITAKVARQLAELEPSQKEAAAPLLKQVIETVQTITLLSADSTPATAEALHTQLEQLEPLVIALFEQIGIAYSLEDVEQFMRLLLRPDFQPPQPETSVRADLEHDGTREAKLHFAQHFHDLSDAEDVVEQLLGKLVLYTTHRTTLDYVLAA